VVALNQAQTSEMLFTQPVVQEFTKLKVPVLLMIGGKDRTAPGANRAAPQLAAELGRYADLGRLAAKHIPDAELVEWPELGHSPQVEAPDVFHQELVQRLAR
jgi:pimeloyl-ACP methyl ester carboxylesterase